MFINSYFNDYQQGICASQCFEVFQLFLEHQYKGSDDSLPDALASPKLSTGKFKLNCYIFYLLFFLFHWEEYKQRHYINFQSLLVNFPHSILVKEYISSNVQDM